MIIKNILLFFFLTTILYSFLRPFSSHFAKWFLRFGSVLGASSVLEKEYIDLIASYIGIQSGRDMLMYLSFVTVFLFVFYTAERFSKLEKKVETITRDLALQSARRNKK